MPTIAEHLRMLRDVQGVHGGFVIAESGSLVDRDLPEAFDEQVFSQVGPRIARLHEAFLSGKREMDVCMLRYADNKLYLRKMTWGFVGVLAAAGVNLAALRMVVNLVVRRIDPEIASPSSVRPPSVTSVPPRPAVRLSPAPAPPEPRPSSRVPLPTPLPPRVAEAVSVIPEDGRDPSPSPAETHVRMYRGRPIGE
jgi:predicted regulator of Ras-like GTPase activity (Roadblock/LC7/MglB family)